MKHYLKIFPKYFEPILSNDKKFELRRIKQNDFKIGDKVVLLEFDGICFTGRKKTIIITYVLALFVYHGFEKPILRYRDKITGVNKNKQK